MSLRDSNIFRDSVMALERFITWAILLSFLMSLSVVASGLDPNERVSQYLRDRWTNRDGFPGGRVNSITQTSDGYLWVATGRGLVRFDGFAFRSPEQLIQKSRSVSQYFALVADRSGALWLQEEGLNLRCYRNNKEIDVASTSDLPQGRVTAISPARDGGVLIATIGLRFFRYNHGKVDASSAPPDFATVTPRSIAETSDGKVWMGSHVDGLFYSDHGRFVAVKEGLPDSKINCLLATENGGLWIGTDKGLAFWDGVRISSRALPSRLKTAQVLSLAQDRDSNIWIGTSNGLSRFNPTATFPLDAMEGETGRAITAIFEDREGNLWVGDSLGLERVREGTFATYSSDEGLPSGTYGPLYVDSENRTWVAPSDGGLYRITNGNVEKITIPDQGDDAVYSITGFGDDIWLGRRRGGLTRLTALRAGPNERFEAKNYTRSRGSPLDGISSAFRSRDGTVWAGTFSGGVCKLQGEKFVVFTTAVGLGSNTVSSIEQSADGAMWFGTSRGLSKLVPGRSSTLTEHDNLPSDEVKVLFEDHSGVLWVGTAAGLAYLSSSRVYSAAALSPLLRESILGIAEDSVGSLWVTTSSHIFNVRREAILNGQIKGGDLRVFGPEDGLRGTNGVRGDRSIVSDHRGRIWLSAGRGVSVVDSERKSKRVVPVIAHLESVSADGDQEDLGDEIRIPPSPQRITFSYIGISLSQPDRVQYRYRLDGFDRNWSEPVDVRQASYTNLGPGRYRFELTASNDSGIWSSQEVDIPILIEPALWQALWFRVACVFTFCFLIWIAYTLRMQHLTKQLDLRLEERLSERVRIAQDLHDTLLQGFLSASMLAHVANEQVPEESDAKPMLRHSLELMRQVTEEGRLALKGIRASAPLDLSLERALARIPEEVIVGEGSCFRVSAEGSPRELNPAVRNDVYLIAREAAVNALRHARARNIEVAISYKWRSLNLVVSDDGCGFDTTILASKGRGNWGLRGMRENSQKIGARLRVSTRIASGTQVILTVPARVAYRSHSEHSLLQRVFRSIYRKRINRKTGFEQSNGQIPNSHPDGR